MGSVVGSVVGAVAGKVLGGSGGGGGGTTTTKSYMQIPKEYKEDFEGLLALARSQFDKPFQPYTGERFAPFVDDQLQAFQGIRDIQGKYSPLLDQASQLAIESANRYRTGITGDDISKFMNPYQQNVIDIARREATRNYDQSLNALRGRAASSGAFGGSRAALMEAELGRNTAQGLDDLQYRGMADSYNQALAAAFKDREGLGEAASNIARIAGMSQEADLRGLGALQASGTQQQGLAQLGADFDYETFLQEQGYDQQRLQNFSDWARDFLFTQVGQARQTAPQPSTAANMLGGAMMGSQMFSGGLNIGGYGYNSAAGGFFSPNSGGTFGAGFTPLSSGGGINWFARDGGKVPSYKCGGIADATKKYADGGRVSGFLGDLGSAFTSKNKIYQYLKDLNTSSAKTLEPYIEDAVEYAKENPLDAASLGLMAIPGANAVGAVGKGVSALMKGAKGVSKASPSAIAKLAGLARRNPNISAAVGAGGLQLLNKALNQEEGQELPEIDVTNEVMADDMSQYPYDENAVYSEDLDEPQGLSALGTAGFMPESVAASRIPGQPQQKSGPNKALLAMGAALMSTPGTFGQGLGAGVQAYLGQKEKEEEMAMQREALARRAEAEKFDQGVALSQLALKQRELEEMSKYREIESGRKVDAKNLDKLNRLDTQIYNQQKLLQGYETNMMEDSPQAVQAKKRMQQLQVERLLTEQNIGTVRDLMGAVQDGSISREQAKAIAMLKGWTAK